MSLQKPYDINLRGATIAAEEDTIIKWKVSGSIQTNFQIDIYNNNDGILAFSSGNIASFDNNYKLLSNSIVNGLEYKIIIKVWDESSNVASSDPVIFQTSSRPIVTIGTIGTIGSPSYNFSATYTQSENVNMKSYIVYLYNSSKKLLKNSNIKTTLPIEYMFKNLQSEQSYYIEFQITSEKGLTGTSGLVSFNVLYTRPQMNVDLKAKNVLDAGIELSWKVIQIIGYSDNIPTFLNNEEVDLTDGNNVYFEQGFNLNKNFTLMLWIKNPILKEKILTISGTNGEIYLYYDTVQEKFILNKLINGNKSEWKSQVVNNHNYYILVQQIEDDMNIQAEDIF